MRRPIKRPIRILASFILGLALLAALYPTGRWGDQIQYWRVEQGMAQEPVVESIKDLPIEELTGIVMAALFAGFRSQAANFCWWKSQQYWEEEGHWPRVLPMMKAACALDPYFPEFWEVTGWHEAYNLAAEYETMNLPIDRYVNMGLATLRSGLEYNPHAVQLYEQLGWTHRDKYGNVEEAAMYARQAALVYHVRAGITKQTAIIQPRFLAHQYEHLAEPEKALRTYQQMMLDYPADNVCIGATLTIRDRYLQAYRAMKAGDLVRAEILVREHLSDDPSDTIALHTLATIRERMNDPWGAMAAWEAAAMVWSDAYAQRRYMEFLEKTGRKEYQLGQVSMENIFISNKIADYVWQPLETQSGEVMRGGMGVRLSIRPGGDDPSPLPPDYSMVKPGDVIVAEPSAALPSVGVDPNHLATVFYLHGQEMGRDNEAPYTLTITPEMLAQSPAAISGDLSRYVKVEMFVRGEFVPRFDLRAVKFSGPDGTVPQPGAPPKGSSPGGPGGAPQSVPAGATAMPGGTPPPAQAGHEGHAH